MKEVNWGIIGAGDVTKVKSGPAFNKIDNSKIIMVMSRTLAKAKDFSLRNSVPIFTDNADEVFNNPEINAVYIATPPSSHAKYTIRTAESGKHVYVEKPMATSFVECNEMIEACQKNKVKLFVAYYRRELEYFKTVKELVQENIIGKISSVNVKLLLPPNPIDQNSANLPWRVKPEIAGAGYFFDLASHQLDFLDLIIGPIKEANGVSTNQFGLYNAEDIVSASFLFESNIIGSGIWNFALKGNKPEDSCELIGSKGRIKYSFFELAPIQVFTNEDCRTIPGTYPIHVQQNLIDTVVKDILGCGNCLSTGNSAARTNWVMEQILNKNNSSN